MNQCERVCNITNSVENVHITPKINNFFYGSYTSFYDLTQIYVRLTYHTGTHLSIYMNKKQENQMFHINCLEVNTVLPYTSFLSTTTSCQFKL